MQEITISLRKMEAATRHIDHRHVCFDSLPYLAELSIDRHAHNTCGYLSLIKMESLCCLDKAAVVQLFILHGMCTSKKYVCVHACDNMYVCMYVCMCRSMYTVELLVQPASHQSRLRSKRPPLSQPLRSSVRRPIGKPLLAFDKDHNTSEVQQKIYNFFFLLL